MRIEFNRNIKIGLISGAMIGCAVGSTLAAYVCSRHDLPECRNGMSFWKGIYRFTLSFGGVGAAVGAVYACVMGR